MPKTNINYSNTIIYKLVCKDPNITDCYVGHTTNFTKRKQQHKENTIHNEKTKVYKFIRENGEWRNWDMVQIEQLPCANSIEAKQRERYWIEQYKSTLNTLIPVRTIDEIMNYRKTYREQNADKIKGYYINNKTEIDEKNKIYMLSERGKEAKKRGSKAYCERNKEVLLQRNNTYREIHKIEINEKARQKREENKEKFKEYYKSYYQKKKQLQENLSVVEEK